jgi:hypothetical protein
MYAQGAAGPVARARLRLLAADGEPAARLERAVLVENAKGAACLEAHYQTGKGSSLSAKYRLKRDEVAVQVEPGAGAGRLRVECPGRFTVLPDFFADDILIDAQALPPGTCELPSESFLLHLAGDGDAVAMCVFENRQQDVKVAVQAQGTRRIITGSDIGFDGKRIWLALLEGPGIWHMHDLQTAAAGKVLSLSWKMPFAGQWRVDFTRPNGLTDSWEMLLPDTADGTFIKPSWLGSGDERLPGNRRRWNTVLGTYPYPCWSDAEGQGYLQPLKNRLLTFQGPAVVYPINRVKNTPLDAYTVVDVMRTTLGVGPCEYILDLEGQKSAYKGRATCSARDELGRIYSNHQQKRQHDKVEKVLQDALIFVTHIRGRITRYVDFGHKMRAYLEEQKKSRPELSEFLAEMEQITGEIDARVAARTAKIKTPAHVAGMNDDFRKNVMDYEGPDALDRCRKYTHALVEIGDNQDELSGECRWVVKSLRQRAGLRLAQDSRVASIAGEIRKRTQEALRNPASHEGARH